MSTMMEMEPHNLNQTPDIAEAEPDRDGSGGASSISREVLVRDVALRVVNHVPKDLIAKEFGLSPKEITNLLASAGLKRQVRTLMAGRENEAALEASLSNEDFRRKARKALNNLETLMDINNPMNPEALLEPEQAISLKASEFILKEAGFGNTQKLEKTVTHKISEEQAQMIAAALAESSVGGRIINVTPVSAATLYEKRSSPPIAEAASGESVPTLSDSSGEDSGGVV